MNDCGMTDMWPVLAKSATWGYGSSGRFGFGHTRVKDRFHRGGHGDFFSERFARDYWLPYLSGGIVNTGEVERPSSPWWQSVLTVAPLKYVILVLAAAALSSALLPGLSNVSGGGASTTAVYSANLAPGKTDYYAVELGSAGRVQVALDLVNPLHELHVTICSAIDDDCESSQIGPLEAFSRELPEGRARVTVFNFDVNPEVEYQYTLDYPR